jgi:hypothetical protein
MYAIACFQNFPSVDHQKNSIRLDYGWIWHSRLPIAGLKAFYLAISNFYSKKTDPGINLTK